MNIGAVVLPNAYTLPRVTAVNGSDANGCLAACVFRSLGISTCDCTKSDEEAAITDSALLDGEIPTIGTSERNSANESEWAAPLFTVMDSAGSVTLAFRFQTRVVLCEVELYIFHCPAWGIGAEVITLYNGASFPHFHSPPSRGSVTLTSDMQNCTSLTRVSIPIQNATSTSSYFILISNPSGTVEWTYIAEVQFSDDQPDTTTMTSTNLTTENATGKKIATILTINKCTGTDDSDVTTLNTTDLISTDLTTEQVIGKMIVMLHC